MKSAPYPIETLRSWRSKSLLAAAVGLVLCGLAAILDLDQFFRSWLVGFLFWWSIAAGALGLLLLHNLTGGRWGEAIRPFLLAEIVWLPVLGLLFLPLALFGLERLYPWTSAEYIEHHPTMPHKAQWLNEPWFLARAGIYFTVWLVVGALAARWVHLRTPGVRRFSGFGLIALVFSASFAAIDWAMSLDPLWHSSIYGALVAMSGALCALSINTWLASTLRTPEMVVGPDEAPEVRADLANLMLAMTMLWTYFGLSQFLIIWSANLPEEAIWYVRRSHGGWQALAVLIVALAFVTPFALLLSAEIKRSPARMRIVVSIILVAQLLHWIWLVGPELYGERLFRHWADLAAVLAIKGILFTLACWRLERRPYVPRRIHAEEAAPLQGVSHE